jgi:large subunit ribosomal protein L33
MSQDKLIKIQNKETGEIYYTRKNKKTVTKKIELKKFSRKLRKHVTFKEIKK